VTGGAGGTFGKAREPRSRFDGVGRHNGFSTQNVGEM
jgi:hypothetical protein